MPAKHQPQHNRQQALYTHERHPHTPRSANERHLEERAAYAARSRYHAFNDWFSIVLYRATGTMECAYLFAGIGIGSIVGYLTNNVLLGILCGALSSYFLQLVFLPVLQRGSVLLSRHSELQAEEMYHDIVRILHEHEQDAKHLAAQDAELIKQTRMLIALLQSAGLSLADDDIAPAVAVSAALPASAQPRQRDARGRFLPRTTHDR